MEPFSVYLKRHGLMLWLANLFGAIATSTLLSLLGTIVFILILFAGVLTFLSIDFSVIDSPEVISSKWFENITTGILGFIAIILSILVLIGLSLFVGTFQVAGNYVIVDEVFKKNRVSIGNYFIKGLKYTFKILVLMMVVSLLFLPIFLLMGFAIYLILTPDLIQIILAIGIFIIALFLSLLFSLAILYAPFILVSENKGVFQSVLLSIRLLQKKFGQVLLSCLLIWVVSLIFVIANLLLYIPVFFSLLDPTGILIAISSITATILQIIFGVVGSPFLLALIGLIIAYRYHKYLRPSLHLKGGNDSDAQETIFTFKSSS